MIHDERIMREHLAVAMGDRATHAPAMLRGGSKYVNVTVSTALRAMEAYAERVVDAKELAA